MLPIRRALPHELPLAVAIDDDACLLYDGIGLDFSLPKDHAYTLAEQRRWRACLEAGSVYFAIDGAMPVGFAALEHLDGAAHLEQLSVLRAHGKRGVGGALLRAAIAHAAGPLTLTTYRHVAWNAPWYARLGFQLLDEATLPAGLRARMAEERAVLPAPEQRVAMRLG
jgi:N-acetylglutamate synthase-like GNAT family acetyltransferase